jgi:hypothetical protein
MNLTPEQMQALESGQAVPLVVAGNRCVLIREDVYRDIDASPWTIEEMDLLADEADELISKTEAHEHPTR